MNYFQIWHKFIIVEQMFSCYNEDEIILIILFRRKEGQPVQQFTEDFKSINNMYGTIILEHSLFGEQIWTNQILKVIDNNEMLGLRVQNHDVYVYKNDVAHYGRTDNEFTISDKNLTITIIMNKL